MPNSSNKGIYAFDEFRLDAEKLMLYRDGAEISLPPKVVKTLAVLVENRGEILSKDELIDAVWSDSIVEESNLSQYLYLLRKTLGSRPDGVPYIETLRRRGYRFTGNSTLLNKAPAAVSVADARPARHYEVERRGNVVALVDWRDDDEPLAASEPVADPKKEIRSRMSPPVALALAFAGLLLLAGFAAYSLKSGAEEPVDANSELTLVRLTNGIDPRDAAISPDGKYFVYHERIGDLSRMWLQQTGHAARVEIIPASERHIYSKTFSPDGQFIYFLSPEMPGGPTSLYRVPTLGGPAARLLTGIDSYVSFSPDGREMVFYRHDKQKGESSYVISASDGSGGERVLYSWTDELPSGANPAWSPDGKVVVFGTNIMRKELVGVCSLVTVGVESGKMTPISDERWDNCYRIAWSPDGRGLYMVGTKAGDGYSIRRDQVYYVSYPQGRSRRLTTDDSRHQLMSLGVTNAGEVLTIPFNRASQIWAMDPKGDSRSAVQITSGLADGRPGIAPLADGRVAYITRTGENLNAWSMNQDGSDQKQLTVDPPYLEELRSGGDGRYLIFSARQGNYNHLYRINPDGTDMRQLTFGDTYEVDSSISNDGKWVAYGSQAFEGTRGEWTLWKVPIEGGEPVLLNRKDCSRPHFSPDDKFISCVTEDDSKVLILSSDDGTLIRSFSPLPLSTLSFGAKWTPDGKSVVYIVSDNWTISNLWLQPVEGGPPKRLTDFTSGSIYHFAYSRDGTRLFVARGQQIHDAVLIKNSEK